MPPSDRPMQAALACLILLQTVMLGSLYTGVAPHPPAATPLFGIAPFLSASLSAACAALILGPSHSLAGRSLAGLAALAGLVSFGPQKYLDPQIGLIWPAVLTGQIAAGTVLLGLPGIARRRAAMTGQ
ncbi:hypothetical protein [Gemmobacter denitrificans]|uniref:Uncharacterized protein n=1 Tax=Gemmobacter denitrificans TaxID=3123040 RepID=A0ABU8BYY6_9RHOB